MSEETKSIQLTEEQHLTLREYNAQLELAEIHLVRLQNAKMHYLLAQDLITDNKEGD
ncbi:MULTISPECIES: hypothetical protein [Enterobacter cloacae complex]|uniref:hypothetical protein n=1 Tax=Enterobacter cloacae complex TaxID=354276 RepID=UPI0013D13ECC|nr:MULTISPECIES: hypothetical protein [Enterobacter cloacae complex]MBG0579341.1 hypothetical protein [Enterobacter kobei]